MFSLLSHSAPCTQVPVLILWLDPWFWGWQQIFFTVAANSSTLLILPWAHMFVLPYALYSTVMGYFRLYCLVLGLVGAPKTRKWTVTAKVCKQGGG